LWFRLFALCSIPWYVRVWFFKSVKLGSHLIVAHSLSLMRRACFSVVLQSLQLYDNFRSRLWIGYQMSRPTDESATPEFCSLSRRRMLAVRRHHAALQRDQQSGAVCHTQLVSIAQFSRGLCDPNSRRKMCLRSSCLCTWNNNTNPVGAWGGRRVGRHTGELNACRATRWRRPGRK